jgi:hypothetical protein
MRYFIGLLCIFLASISCQSKLGKDSIKILVIGDVQLKCDLKRFSESDWRNQNLLAATTPDSLINESTVFKFRQESNIVKAEYKGCKILVGHLLGKM